MSKIEDLYHKYFDGMHYEDVTEEMIIKFTEDYSSQVIEEKLRWIPIEEKLPKQGEEVITKTSDNWFRIMSFGSVGHNRFPSQVTHWRFIL